MNALPMDLVAGDADVMKRSANRNRAPETADADFSRYLGEPAEQEETAQADPSQGVVEAGMTLPEVTGMPPPAAPSEIPVIAGKIPGGPDAAGADPAALPSPAGAAQPAADDLQSDPAPAGGNPPMPSDDAVPVTAEAAGEDTAPTPETGVEPADLSQDAELQGGMGGDQSESGQQETARQDPGQPVPQAGEPGRGFSSGAEALYGVTATLSARSEGASASPGAQQAQLIAQQITQVVQTTPGGAVELALSPEELGRLRMVLQSDDGKLHVTIQAERPETQDLLRRHVDGLERDFRQAGYGQVTFSFGDRGRDRPDRPAIATTFSETPETDSIAPLPRAILRIASGLDLRI